MKINHKNLKELYDATILTLEVQKILGEGLNFALAAVEDVSNPRRHLEALDKSLDVIVEVLSITQVEVN